MFDAIPGKRRTKKLVEEPRFAHPPLWIHESLAAILGKESPLLISRRREAKRRALLQMLDRLPIRSERAAQVSKPAPGSADLTLPRAIPGISPRAQK
ncbi:MAG TPA: hypothetical protein VEQ87_04335 [Burkholderiales bacterium]|nr:hypothetical protein [Burkholderiales bacterium]